MKMKISDFSLCINDNFGIYREVPLRYVLNISSAVV